MRSKMFDGVLENRPTPSLSIKVVQDKNIKNGL